MPQNAVGSEGSPYKPKTRAVTLAIQVGVSAALIAGLLYVVDWQDLRHAFTALSVGGVFTVVLLNFVAQASLIWRWRALLETANVEEPLRGSWDAVFGGLFLNNFLPGTLGSDGLRILLLARASGNATVAIGTVVYERIVHFAIYALLVILASLWPFEWLEPWQHLAIIGCGASGMLALWVILKWLRDHDMKRVPIGAGLWQRGWSLVRTMLAETGHMQARLRRHRGAQLLFLGSSLVNVTFIFAMFVVALHDLGHPIHLPTIIFAVGIASISTGLPISFGGIGVYEAALVIFFGLGGVPSGDALLIALVMRGSAILVSLVGLPSALTLWGDRQRSK